MSRLPGSLGALGRRPRLVVEVDLRGRLLSQPPADLVSRLLARGSPVLPTLLDRLAELGADRRVGAVVLRLGGQRLGVAAAQELREAVVGLRAAGRFTLAWAESLGEFGPATGAVLVAGACDEVWLQPSGDLGLTGVAVEGVFVREALDRLGVDPQLSQRHEFKNAADLFLRREFTPAHREASERIAESALEGVVAAVAADRRLGPDRVRELVDAAPLSAADAVAAGLADRVGYRDQAYAAARERAGPGARLVRLDRHRPAGPARRLGRRLLRRRRPVVAVVGVSGAIQLGRSGRAPNGPTAGADTVAAGLRAAGADPRVAAVLLEVDSPGGSYAASDAIWWEVARLREGGRPVVVAMGQLAASGGYFVACGADRIVALPATLTGSIGVFGGKAVVSGLLARAGIGTDAAVAGRNARIGSTRSGYDPDQRQLLEGWLDRVYADFVGRVAQGRGLQPQRVEQLARGRVWTGADALGLGLVDALGGRATALRTARELGRLPDRAAAVRYPRTGRFGRLRPAADGAGRGLAAGLAGLGLPAGLEPAPGAHALLAPPIRLR